MKKVAIYCFVYLAIVAAKADSSDSSSSSEGDDLLTMVKKAFREMAQECRDKEHGTNDDIEAIIECRKESTYQSKCIGKCMMQTFDLMTPAGKLSVDGFKQLAGMLAESNEKTDKIIEKVAEKCRKIEEKDDCLAAYKYGMCIKDEAVALGLYKE